MNKKCSLRVRNLCRYQNLLMLEVEWFGFVSVCRLQLLFSSWHFLKLPKSICITGHVLYNRVRRARAAGPLLSAADHRGQQTQNFSTDSSEISHGVRSKDGLVCNLNYCNKQGQWYKVIDRLELGDPGRTEIHVEVLSLREPGMQVFWILWAGVLFSPFWLWKFAGFFAFSERRQKLFTRFL